MKDPWNPTLKEIKDWAYGTEFEMEDDWDLAFEEIDDDAQNELILQIAADPKCRAKRFFLHLLHIKTGFVARYAGEKGFNQAHLKKLLTLLVKAEALKSPLLADWITKSKAVIRDPKSFVYKDWYGE